MVQTSNPDFQGEEGQIPIHSVTESMVDKYKHMLLNFVDSIERARDDINRCQYQLDVAEVDYGRFKQTHDSIKAFSTTLREKLERVPNDYISALNKNNVDEGLKPKNQYRALVKAALGTCYKYYQSKIDLSDQELKNDPFIKLLEYFKTLIEKSCLISFSRLPEGQTSLISIDLVKKHLDKNLSKKQADKLFLFFKRLISITSRPMLNTSYIELQAVLDHIVFTKDGYIYHEFRDSWNAEHSFTRLKFTEHQISHINQVEEVLDEKHPVLFVKAASGFDYTAWLGAKKKCFQYVHNAYYESLSELKVQKNDMHEAITKHERKYGDKSEDFFTSKVREASHKLSQAKEKFQQMKAANASELDILKGQIKAAKRAYKEAHGNLSSVRRLISYSSKANTQIFDAILDLQTTEYEEALKILIKHLETNARYRDCDPTSFLVRALFNDQKGMYLVGGDYASRLNSLKECNIGQHDIKKSDALANSSTRFFGLFHVDDKGREESGNKLYKMLGFRKRYHFFYGANDSTIVEDNPIEETNSSSTAVHDFNAVSMDGSFDDLEFSF